MNKKFSIINTIDLDKLNDEIHKYIMQTGETNPYIFMSKDTSDAIDEAFPTLCLLEPCHKVNCQGKIGYWEGYRIFIDDNLKFGIVEIR